MGTGEKKYSETTVTSSFSDELAQTSLPGIAYIVRPTRLQIFSRILWFIVLNALGALTGFLIYQRVLFFNSNPTSSETSSKLQQSLPFSAVIVCNWNPMRTSALDKHELLANVTASDIEQTLSNTLALRDVLPLLAHHPNDTIFSCSFEGVDCRKHVQPVFTDMGLCAGINLDGSLKATREHFELGLKHVLNNEKFDFFNVQKFANDERMKKNNKNPFQGQYFQVMIGWSANVPVNEVRKSGMSVENEQSLTLLLETEEWRDQQCTPEQQARTLQEFAPDDTTYLRIKCEQVRVAEALWQECHRQYWYPPYANFEAGMNFTFLDWLIRPDVDESSPCVRATARRLDNDTKTCTTECYSQQYNIKTIKSNKMVLPLLPNCTMEECLKLYNRSNPLVNELEKVVTSLNRNLATVQKQKHELESQFLELFKIIDSIYDGTSVVPIHKRTKEEASLAAMIPGSFETKSVGGMEKKQQVFLVDVWLTSNCSLPENVGTGAARQVRPLKFTETLERMWHRLSEHITSRRSWRRFHVIRPHEPPFEFLAHSGRPHHKGDVEQVRANFSAVDAWLHSELPVNLQRAVRSHGYPIMKQFTLQFDLNFYLPAQFVQQARNALFGQENDEPSIDELNVEHAFWQAFDVLRWLMEAQCLTNETLIYCANVTRAFAALHESIADDRDFDDLYTSLKNGLLDSFSGYAEMWSTDERASGLLLASQQWSQLYTFGVNYADKPEYSFTNKLKFLEENLDLLKSELLKESTSIANIIQAFSQKILDRKLRQAFGVGPCKTTTTNNNVSVADPMRWRDCELAMVTDHMVRFLREVSENARTHVFDLPLAKALDECAYQYKLELNKKRLELGDRFSQVSHKLDAIWHQSFEHAAKLVVPYKYPDWYKSNFAEVNVRLANTILKSTTQRAAYDFLALICNRFSSSEKIVSEFSLETQFLLLLQLFFSFLYAVDFGGIVGLTLGFSFVTIVEVLYVLFTTLASHGRWTKRRNMDSSEISTHF